MLILRKIRQRLADAEAYKRCLSEYRRREYAACLRILDGLGDRHKRLMTTVRRKYGLAQRALGFEAMDAGAIKRARIHLRVAAEMLPDDAKVGRKYAVVLAQMGMHSASGDAYLRTCRRNGGSASDWIKCSQAMFMGGRREHAVMTLIQAMREVGNNAEMFIQMGLFRAREDRYEDARREFENAVACDETNVRARRYLAMAAGAMGDIAAALGNLQAAFTLNPKDTVLARQLAIAMRAAQESGLEIEVELSDSPVNRTLRGCDLAEYMLREPEFIEALLSQRCGEVDVELLRTVASELDRVVREHPDYADMLYHSSRVYQRLGDMDVALARASQAVATNGNYVKGLMQLADICSDMGDTASAIRYLERAIACGADWPDVHCKTGELLRNGGKRRKANIHLRRALELKPNYERARMALDVSAA